MNWLQDVVYLYSYYHWQVIKFVRNIKRKIWNWRHTYKDGSVLIGKRRYKI